MKKRTKNLWIVALAFSASLCMLSACKDKKLEAVKDYEWTYNPEFQDECDEDMTIDGVLDEARWEGRDWLTHAQGGVAVQYTTLFTEKGLYIGAIAKDEDIQWNSRLNMGYYNSYLNDGVMNADNSTFWFRVSAENEKDYHTFTAYNFFMDAKDRASRNQTRFQAKTALNGALGEANEMTAELFVTWEALHMEIPEGAEFPQAVRICPAYRYVKEENSGENKWILPSFYTLNAYRLRNNGVFTADGYGNPDAENAQLGTSALGLSKSDGWDLSQLTAETPSVKTTWAHDQAIFFKNINSDTYVYSAKVKLLPETWGEGSGGAGLIDMVSPSEFISLYVYANHLNVDKAGNHQEVWIGLYGNLRDLGTLNTRYNDKLCLTLPYEERYSTEGITLTVIKNGAWMYYFAEGQLVYAGMFSMLQGVTAPGLYTLTRQAEFTDFYAKDYANDKDGLLAELNRYAYTVTTEATGGAVKLDKMAIGLNESGATEDLVFSLEPTSGYILTSLEIEGTTEDSDYYQYAISNIKDGVLTIDKSKLVDNISIKAKFTTYRAGSTRAATVKVTGKVTSAGDGNNVNGASVTIRNADNPLMLYNTTVNNGTYSFYVLRAGTHEIGGRTITTAGNYTVEVEMPCYFTAQSAVTVPATQEADTSCDIVISERQPIGGFVTLNGMKLASDTTYWTPDETDSDTVYATTGGNCTHYYFTGVTSEKAVIEFTFTNESDPNGNYDKSPSIGVRFESNDNGTLRRFEVGATINNVVYYTNTGGWGNKIDYQTKADFNLLELGKAHTFRFVRDNDTVALFVKQDTEWVELLCVTDPLFAGVRAYPISYREGDGDKTFKFSDCKITYQSTDTVDGVPFDEFVKNTFYKEIHIADYEQGLGSIEFVRGVEELDGKYYAYRGDEIAIKVVSDEAYKIAVGSDVQDGEGNGTYTFTFQDECEVGLYPTNLMKQDTATGEIVYDGPVTGASQSQYYYLAGSGKRVYLNTTITTDAGGGVHGTEGIIIKVGEQERRVLFAGSGVYIFTEKDGTHNGNIEGAQQYTNSGVTDVDGNYAIYQSLVTFGKYFDTEIMQQTGSVTPYGKWYGNGAKYTMGDISACNNVTYLIENGYLYIALGETAETATAYLKLDLDCLFGDEAIDQDTVYQIGYASSGRRYGNANYHNGNVEAPAYAYKTNELLFDDGAYDAAEAALNKFGESVPYYEKNLDDGVWIDGSKLWGVSK